MKFSDLPTIVTPSLNEFIQLYDDSAIKPELRNGKVRLKDLGFGAGTGEVSATYTKLIAVTGTSNVKLDASEDSTYYIKLNTQSSSISFDATTFSAAAKSTCVRLYIEHTDVSQQIAWGSNVRWANKVTPVLSASLNNMDCVELTVVVLDATTHLVFGQLLGINY